MAYFSINCYICTEIMTKKINKNKIETLSPLRSGIVVRNTGSAYLVRIDGSDELPVPCRIKGNFRIKGVRTTNPVAVGDRVKVAEAADDADYIVEIMPRRNYIIRRASNLSKESHILAANIDKAILVATLREPVTTTTFIDRFLATAEAYSIPAVILLNKQDLWDEEDIELADALKYLYEGMGYQVIFTSAESGHGLDALRDITKGQTSLLAGNSGVGKSSIINAIIPGANLKTGKISDIHHTGMHTTTFSEMLELPYGGYIIDIPGVKGFGTIDFEPAEVSHYFPDIFHYGHDCKYGDCRHIDEPGCAVKQALEDHNIAQSRYASYLSVLADATDNDDKYRKPF